MSTTAPFSLLWQNAGNPEQHAIFSDDAVIESYLATERALAVAQGELGVIDQEHANLIADAAVIDNIDRDQLWKDARNVGYPILGLVRQVSAHLPEGANGRVHYGATTQDIMDTGLVMQMLRSLEYLDAQMDRLGTALAKVVTEHRSTVMPGRTHAQQAVPTTLGATMATLLDQLRRQRERLQRAHENLRVVSLYGAGGTNAAQGEKSTQTRARVAELLGLKDAMVPWHVDRDLLSEYGWVCAQICGTVAKFGRNIVDLSRTEIAEVFEPYNSHRGASSTMPQKVNPISSELMIGIATVAGALSSALVRIQESGHERAAGEWQGEWFLVPQFGCLAGAALSEAIVVAEGMRIDPERMRQNLDQDGGLIMAEAMMIQLAPAMGREHAHDVVYEACTRAREQHRVLQDVMPEIAEEKGIAHLMPEKLYTAADYVNEAPGIADAAVAQWNEVGNLEMSSPMSSLARK